MSSCLLATIVLLLQEVSSEERTYETSSEGWWIGQPQPHFADTPTNISYISGQTAYLPCRVHILGDKSILHSEEREDWTLRIQSVQPRDAGVYTCQVNADPKIAKNVYVSVTDTRFIDDDIYKIPPNDGGYSTYILGPVQRFLQSGSALILECVVRHLHAKPTSVFWYHNSELLNYDSERGGIMLQVDRNKDETTGRLKLSSVGVSDSGNYTCLPERSPGASVSVHVNSDELRAAVQQGDSTRRSPKLLLGSPLQVGLFWSSLWFIALGGRLG